MSARPNLLQLLKSLKLRISSKKELLIGNKKMSELGVKLRKETIVDTKISHWLTTTFGTMI